MSLLLIQTKQEETMLTMYLSDEAVQKFKETFKKIYGKEYTDTETREAAGNLVGFFDLLIKVDQRIKNEKIKKD